jgi:concanavalin A-like lectin/glucanase superfamily protein
MRTLASVSALVAALLLAVAFACDHGTTRTASPSAPTAQDLVSDDALLLLDFNGDLVDQSVYARTVYFAGGSPDYRNGCNDQAIMFSGADYAYVNGDASLQPARVTVEVWMSPKHALTNHSGFNPLVVKYAGNFWNTVDGYDLWYQDSGAGGRVGFGIGTSGGTIRKHASLYTTLSAGRLYHIVGTFDGSYARLYINGEQVAATAYSSPLAYLGGGIRIGGGVYHSYYGGWQYYRGIIDRVAIYPRAMTDEEIALRYLSCNLHVLVQSGREGTKDDGSFSER